MSSDFMIFVDPVLVEQKFSDYFKFFDIEIIQYNKLSDCTDDFDSIYSLIIHWSLLETNPEKITQLFSLYPVPIIIINDFNDFEACIKALEAGADDFLTKPLNPRHLHARISAIKRRVSQEEHQSKEGKAVLMFAQWKLHLASRQLFDNSNRELPLSSGEYDLLLAFVQRPQQVLDREFLLHSTKNDDLCPLDRRIDVQISRLRQKIEIDPKKPELIQTVRNNGYIFTGQVVRVSG